MTFNPNIPQPNDFISASQAQIQTNFSQLETIFDVNHVTFDDAAAVDRGKHRHAAFIEVTDPATAANEIAVYCKDVAGSSRMFMRQENNGTVIQTTGADPIVGANGSSFLPGNSSGPVIMKWGTFSMGNGVTSQAVNFISAFSSGVNTIVLTSTSSNSDNTAGVNQGSITVNGFTAFRGASPANALTYHYIAIGN